MNWKKNFLCTWLALASLVASTQETVSDRTVAADTTAINALLASSKNSFGSDPAASIRYSLQAKALSEQIDYKKGLALALKNLGIANFYQGNNLEALAFYQQSLKVFQTLNDDNGIANIQSNIGAIYTSQGDDAKALDYFLKSLQLAEKTGDKLRILTAMNNIGAIYQHNDSTYDKALKYDLKALPLAEDLDDKEAIGTISVNIGRIYTEQKKYALAMRFFKKSLHALQDSESIPFTYNSIGELYLEQNKYNLALQNHQQALTIAKKLNGKLDILQSLQGLGRTYAGLNNNKIAIRYFNEAERIGQEIDAPLFLMWGYRDVANSYAKIGDYLNAYDYYKKFKDYSDTLYNNETDKKLANLQFDFDLQKKEGEITNLRKDNILRESEVKRQRLAKNAFSIGFILVFILAFAIYRNYRIKAKSNRILDRKNLEIEGLLLNILPAEVATELQTTGQATPKHYENVSVLFTDFKGFTSIADKMSPEEVVEELNTCFVAFDTIIGKYNLEKIKTIGDSYMCAGGIPGQDPDHVCNMIKASLEMLAFIESYNRDRLEKELPVWDIRIGVHVGPVVAGVVGKKKYAYDIWGSTVNIASRMESNGYPGLVNISAATYEQVKDQYVCNHRGKIYAKNVGDIDMYFVSHENISYPEPQQAIGSSDGVANELFQKSM